MKWANRFELFSVFFFYFDQFNVLFFYILVFFLFQIYFVLNPFYFFILQILLLQMMHKRYFPFLCCPTLLSSVHSLHS